VDSGTHMALDELGRLYTVASSYADMSDQQKDDVNKFAHQNPNGIVTA